MIADVKNTCEHKMKRTLETLKLDLSKIRTGRPHTGLLDHVMVDYYGNPTPVSQVGNITLADGRTLSVQPWEKNMVSKIDKAIRESDLGLNPQINGDIILVPMPPLTEERRREMIKVVKHEGENAKVAIRNLRRDAIHHLKEALKNKEVGEDEEHRAQDEIQKLTDKSITEVDKVVTQKESELLSV